MHFYNCIICKIKNVTPHFKFYLRKVFIVAFSLFLCLTSFTSVHAVEYVDASTFSVPTDASELIYIHVSYSCYSAKVSTFGNGLSGLYSLATPYLQHSYTGLSSELVFDCTDFTPADGYFTIIRISQLQYSLNPYTDSYATLIPSDDDNRPLHIFWQFPLDFDSTLWCSNSSCSSASIVPYTDRDLKMTNKYWGGTLNQSTYPFLSYQDGLTSSEDGKHLYNGDSSYWSLAFTNSNKVSYLMQYNFSSSVSIGSVVIGNGGNQFVYSGSYFKPDYCNLFVWYGDNLPLSSVDGSDSASSVWDNIDFQDGNNLGSDWLSKFNFSIFNPFAILIPIFIDEATFCPATLSEWLHLDNTMCVSSPWISEIRQPMTVAFNILISCFLFGFLINWLRNGVAPFENSISPVNFDNSKDIK